MGKQGHECDEELAASIDADWICDLGLEGFRALVEGVDELEHGAGCGVTGLWKPSGLDEIDWRTIGVLDELCEGDDGCEGIGDLKS
jgi:hypothetical protein